MIDPELIKLANTLIDLQNSDGWRAFLKLLDKENEILQIQLVNSQTDNQLRLMQGAIMYHRKVKTMIPDFVNSLKRKAEKEKQK